MALFDRDEGLRRFFQKRDEEALVAPAPLEEPGLRGHLLRSEAAARAAPPPVAPEPAPFRSGIESLKATARGVAAQVATELNQPEIAEEQLAAAQRNIAEAQRLAPKGDARNPLEYIERVVGTQAPNLAASAVGAALGRKLLGPKVGPLVGGAVTSTSIESGSIFTGIAADPQARANLPLKDISRISAVGGLAAGSFDALPITRVFNKFGVGNAWKQALREGFVKRAAKGAVAGSIGEGVTEPIQTVIERATHKFVNDNYEIFGEEGTREILSATAAGATLGGLLGPLEGFAGAPAGSPEARTSIDERIAQLEADDELGAAFGAKQATGELAANFDRTVARRRRGPETIVRGHVKEESVADLDAPTIDAITKIATGELEMTPAIRQMLEPRFNYFNEMIDQIRRAHGLSPENVELEGIQSGIEPGTREDTGVFDEEGNPVRADAQAAMHPKFRFKDEDLGGSATLDLANLVHGKAFPNTSTQRELDDLREDDPNSEYTLVPLDEAVRQELADKGLAPEAVDAELARRGQARFDQALAKLTDSEKAARLTSAFDPANPAAFLKKFEVIHEQVLPEIVQQGDEDVLTREDMKADPETKRKSIFDKGGKEGGLYDGQFLVQDKDTTRKMSAPRLVRRMLQKQGVKNLDNPTREEIKSAYAGGINAMTKLGMSIKTQLPANSTVAFSGGKRVLFSDITTAGQKRLAERGKGLREQQNRVAAQARAQETIAEVGRAEGGLVGQARTEKALARGADLGKVAGKLQEQADLTDAELRRVKDDRQTIGELETKAKALEQNLVRDLSKILPSTAKRIESALNERNRSGVFTRLFEARDAIEKKSRAEGNDIPKQQRYQAAAARISEFLFNSRDTYAELDTLAKGLGNLGVIHTSPRLEAFRDDNAAFAAEKRGEEKETERAEVRRGEQGEITDITTEEITGEISTKPRTHVTSESKLLKAQRMVNFNRGLEDVLGQVAFGTMNYDAALEIVGKALGPAVIADIKRSKVNSRDNLVNWLDRRRVQTSTILALLDSTEGRFDEQGLDPIVNDPKLGVQEHRVLHASPHAFEKFSTEFAKSGEGVQAFGWGLYFTDSEEVLAFYHDKFSGKRYKVDIAVAPNQYLNLNKPFSEQSDNVKVAFGKLLLGTKTTVADWVREEQRGLKAYIAGNERRLSKVTPGLTGERLTRAVARFADDIQNVQKRLDAVNAMEGLGEVEVRQAIASNPMFSPSQLKVFDLVVNPLGQSMYDQLTGKLGSQEAASKAMLAEGVRGNRYLSEGGTGGGKGSFNYVIFDASDTVIEAQFARDVEIPLEDLAESIDPAVLWEVGLDVEGKERLNKKFTELQATLDGWVKALGLEDSKIRLVMPGEMKDFILKAYSAKTGPAALEKFRRGGHAGQFIPGANIILISPFIDPDLFNEVMAHEFGHAIFAIELVALFTSTDAKDKELAEAIVRDFLAWREKHGRPGAEVRDIQGSKKAFISSITRGETVTLETLSESDQNYALDFNEWFADSVARALTAEGKPQNVVEAFFVDLIAKIKKFIGLFEGSPKDMFLPPRSVTEFLQAMYHDRRTEVMERKSRPTEAALMDALYERYAAAGKAGQPGRQKLYQYLNENVKMAATNRKVVAEAMDHLGERSVKGHYARQASSAGAGQQHAPFSEQTREKVKRAITGWLKPEERRVLGQALTSLHVVRQLRAALAPYPVILARVEADPLEALSYAYQLWMAGQIDIGPKTQNLFQRFHDFVQEMFGLVSVGKEAENVLKALSQNLDSGARDPLLNILEGPTKTGRLNRAAKFVNRNYQDVHHVFGKLFYTASSRMYHTGNPVLRQLADLVHPRVGGEGAKQGMLEARRERIARFMVQRAELFDGVDEETKAKVMELLQNPKLGTTDPELGRLRGGARKLMRDVLQYTKSKGVEIGDIGTDYFPWVFDPAAMGENRSEFEAMLKQPKYAAKIAELAKEWNVAPALVPEMIVEHVLENNGVADSRLTAAGALKRTPYMASLNPRNLDWIQRLGNEADGAVLAKVFSKDIDSTIITYVHQAVKRAEFVARFGEKGDKLEAMFKQAKELGASDDDLKLMEHYMAAVTGTLGTKTNERLTALFGGTHKPGEVINPALRLGMSALMVVQNLAILSLATFTSLADPVGILVRGGSLDEGLAALKAGAKEIIAAANDEKTDLASLAEALGAIEDSATLEALEWEYGSTYLTPGLKWANETFFKTIGLTQLTRMTRLMAVAGGLKFLEKHADGTFNKHSKRYLDQLGLTIGDVQLTNGALKVLNRQEREDATPEDRARDDRVRSALNRFVDESILRPDATQRPIWASDPHWMLVWHLKSFTYSFYETILKRVASEMGERNIAPALMLGLFVPVMLGSDLLRELFTQGEVDDDKDLGDRLLYATERSGLTGLKQFLLDAQQDQKYGGVGFESFAGPTATMIGKLPGLFSDDSEKQWKTFQANLPYQNTWKHWFAEAQTETTKGGLSVAP